MASVRNIKNNFSVHFQFFSGGTGAGAVAKPDTAGSFADEEAEGYRAAQVPTALPCPPNLKKQV